MNLLRTFLAAVHLLVVVALLLCGLNAVVSPVVFPYLNLLSLAFPALLGIHVALSVLWLLLRRKRAVFFLLISIFFFKPAQRWINFTPEKKPGNFKVITYNGHYNGGENDAVRNYLLRHNADVVFHQEYRPAENFYPFVKQESVVAISSAHRIVNYQLIDIGDGNSQAMAADIQINGKVIRFINIYLEPFYINKDLVKSAAKNEMKAEVLKNRLLSTFRIHGQQVPIIQKFIKNSPYPVIVGGDLNSVPNSFEYYSLSEGLQDAFTAAGRGSATSFHDFKFPIRIDYLFCSKDILPSTYRVDRGVRYSDHYPVIATFTLK
ncbi:endonuclease/exonuclease/phosphatase family protein [Cruoricaptor ignavus]|uniref:Endonuclease/exonuclease/phosphatase family protein n=1 Tax=Cruoricaptor ignavus TaxID=1118202 RepID=A0A7M1T1V0_9FLAO|nr:endonuclease/exonuclease/phosphatase family protein [Cruoricaptor ignavus]QOR73114.1 endonuclease/exonuclease/phosphatase family protein [Cruoricaptor ignavus]